MMKIVLFSNVTNHYMLPLIEEFNIMDDVEAYFVETEQLPEFLKKGGFREYWGNNIIKAWKDHDSWNRAMEMAVTADVMMIGSAPEIFILERLKRKLLTFRLSERPLKKGYFYKFQTNLIFQIHYFMHYRNKPVYMLCFSGFAALDYYSMQTYKGKCYKFAYLPRIEAQDVEQVLSGKRMAEKIKFIWCARFLDWKHPELPVLLAQKLKSDGYDFELNMIGSGEELDKIKTLIENKNVSDCVHLLGNFPNSEVLKIMKEHHIFLFTSDKYEGWGVVLNEAMGQLCCPVTSNLIGATPYLVQHKKNGLIFKSEDVDSLYNSVKYLLNNPEEIYRMSKEAYKTVSEVWNPKFCAQRFIELCKSLQNGGSTPYTEGPCSISTPKDGVMSF